MASLLDSGMVVVIFITGIEKSHKKDQWLLVHVRLGRVYLFAEKVRGATVHKARSKILT
jgi:hypothetical protein